MGRLLQKNDEWRLTIDELSNTADLKPDEFNKPLNP